MAFIAELKRKCGEIGLRKHHVPEWSRDVYFKPVTPHETSLVQAALGPDEPAVFYSVQLVVLKALDQSGKRLFRNDDFDELVRMPYQSAFIELAGKMQERPDVEELKKSSGMTES